jgi:hypothetical protein
MFCGVEKLPPPFVERAKKTSLLGTEAVFACHTTCTFPLASTPTWGLLAFPVLEIISAPEKLAAPLLKRLYMTAKLPVLSLTQTILTLLPPSTATCALVELPPLLETVVAAENDCPLSVERLKEI